MINKEILDDILHKNPTYVKTKHGFLIPVEGIGFFHCTNIKNKNVEDRINQKYGKEATWYTGFCSEEDLEKIFKPRSANDELLAFQAESISLHPRIYRTFLSRKGRIQNWSLETHYKKHNIQKRYFDSLSKGNQNKVKNIPVNTAYLESVNAFCIKKKSVFIVFSEPLEQFLFFMNLFGYADIPFKDMQAAYSIAMRTMLGFESFDFDLDPRFDNLDKEYIEIAKEKTKFQMDFIIGHEYSHYLLGHLTAKNSVMMKISSSMSDDNHIERKMQTFSYAKKNEFDADWYSIKNINCNNVYKNELTNAAFELFIYFAAFDKIKSFFAYRASYSHPAPIDRIWNLRKKINKRFGMSEDEIKLNLNSVLEFTNDFIKEYLVFNVDHFEMKGSFYLPSYTNLPLRRDRIDF